MKQPQTLYVIERKSQLAIYITEQLLELERFEQTEQVTAAIQLRDLLLKRLGEMAIRLSEHRPAQAAVMIEAETATETPAEPAQTDYSALLEQQEKGVTDEVGTKV